MQQVPFYGIIGAGRMAKHMCYYLSNLQIPFQQWSRKQDPDKQQLKKFIKTSDLILLLIDDDAIVDFIQQHPDLTDKPLRHFSGQLHTELAYSAHPLMTFIDIDNNHNNIGATKNDSAADYYDSSLYQKIPFIIEEDGPDLQQLLPGLTNPYYKIPAASKAYYHSLCVLSANFSCLLWQKMFDELGCRWGIPSESIYPYLEQTTINLRRGDALTGPLVRDDKHTIEQHLQALADDPFLEVYRAFCHSYQQTKSEKKNEY